MPQPVVDERADLLEHDAARVEEHEVRRVVPREREVAHAVVRPQVRQLAACAVDYPCHVVRLEELEWSFGKCVVLWVFCDFKKNQKLYLQPVAKYWLSAVLLTNCHSCLYGDF